MKKKKEIKELNMKNLEVIMKNKKFKSLMDM
jgi:hypothetical protein